MVFRDKADESYIEQPKNAATNINDSLLSILYSQGKYFVYHSSDIDLKLQEKWD
jgi:hypothetical protein